MMDSTVDFLLKSSGSLEGSSVFALFWFNHRILKYHQYSTPDFMNNFRYRNFNFLTH